MERIKALESLHLIAKKEGNLFISLIKSVPLCNSIRIYQSHTADRIRCINVKFPGEIRKIGYQGDEIVVNIGRYVRSSTERVKHRRIDPAADSGAPGPYVTVRKEYTYRHYAGHAYYFGDCFNLKRSEGGGEDSGHVVDERVLEGGESLSLFPYSFDIKPPKWIRSSRYYEAPAPEIHIEEKDVNSIEEQAGA